MKLLQYILILTIIVFIVIICFSNIKISKIKANNLKLKEDNKKLQIDLLHYKYEVENYKEEKSLLLKEKKVISNFELNNYTPIYINKKVIIASSNLNILKILRKELINLGFIIDLVSNEKDLLKKVGEIDNYDIVLIDNKLDLKNIITNIRGELRLNIPILIIGKDLKINNNKNEIKRLFNKYL